MKICFIPSSDLSYESGSVINAIWLINQASKKGHSVTILAKKPPKKKFKNVEIIVNSTLLEHSIITDRIISNKEISNNFMISLQFLLDKGRDADIVIIQYFSFSSYAASIFQEITGIPFVTFSFGRDISSRDQLTEITKKMQDISVKKCKYIVFPTASIKKDYDRKINGCIYTSLILPPSIDDIVLPKKKLIKKSNEFIISSINSCFKLEKGIDVIIKAFSKCLLKQGNIRLYIAGKDDHPNKINYKRLKEIVNKLNLEKKVIFTGYLSREGVEHLLSISDIFIDARSVSNFSSVVIEALAHKCVVISADNDSACETIDPYINGLLFKSGDINNLSCLISELIEHPEKRSQLKNGAEKWWHNLNDKFIDKSSFNKFEAFIKEIII